MKRRARRAAIGAAALVAVIVAFLVVANWGTLRDHVESWHFQLTRETRVVKGEGGRCGNVSREENLFIDLTVFSGRAVIFACDEDDEYDPPLPADMTLQGVDGVLRVLASMGYRVLEQRFSRRAYVVINPSLARASGHEPDRPRSWGLSERDKDDLRKALSGAR